MISTMSVSETNGSVQPENGEEEMEEPVEAVEAVEPSEPVEQSSDALSSAGKQEEGNTSNENGNENGNGHSGEGNGDENGETVLPTYASAPVPYAGAPSKKEEDPFRNLTTAADQEAPATNANDTSDAKRYVRLRGLPFSATDSDVKEFFGDITVQSLHFTQGFGGRPSGECYCELASSEDVKKAMELDKKTMKKRYIEVFEVAESELSEHVGRVKEQEAGDGCVVRLRGLPFSATAESISEFMDGCQVVDVVIEKENGGEGRPSGEAYVRLAGRDDAERALQLNRKHMGHRYIEVFRSTTEEMQRCNNPAPKMNRPDGAPVSLLDMAPIRPPPGWSSRGGDYDGYEEFPRRPPPMQRGYGGGGGGGGGGGRYDHGGFDDYGGGGYDDYGYGRPPMPFRGPRGRPGPYDRPPRAPPRGDWNQGASRVQMRGLPYKSTAEEISEFFAPLPIVDVLLGYGEDGRPSGDGAVEFESPADAREAMGRNHNLMGKRYIELFLGYDGVPGTRSRLRSIWGGRRFSQPSQPRRPPMGSGRSPGMGPPSYDGPSDYGRPPNYDQYSSGDMYGGGGGGGYDAAPIAPPVQAAPSVPQGQHSYHQQYEQQQQQYWQQAQQAQHAAATAQAMAAATNSSWQSAGAQQPIQTAQKTGGPPSWINY